MPETSPALTVFIYMIKSSAIEFSVLRFLFQRLRNQKERQGLKTVEGKKVKDRPEVTQLNSKDKNNPAKKFGGARLKLLNKDEARGVVVWYVG
jgi:hypothetical protein